MKISKQKITTEQNTPIQLNFKRRAKKARSIKHK